MPKRKILDQRGLNYLTLTVVGWVDVFTRKRYRDIIIESLNYCRKEKGLIICAYVIMSNHIHLIAQVEEGNKWTLSDVLRDFKKYTANRILESIINEPESRRDWMLIVFGYHGKYKEQNRNYQFWVHGNHPTALYSPKVIWEKIAYIHANPVRADIVDRAEDYIHSSARQYSNEHLDGPLEIDLLPPLMPGGFVYVPS